MYYIVSFLNGSAKETAYIRPTPNRTSMAQNNIIKTRLQSLGYHFIEGGDLPAGEDEYYFRNQQNRSGIEYRRLTAYEIEALVRNRNTSDNWNHILVSDNFNPELVRNCKFYGLVRIGKLEQMVLSFGDIKLPVGLYNSTIISCDFGDNIAIENVRYMSHYIIGSDVMITNVDELVTTNHAKFGNGIVKDGEPENIRIWLELANENGNRSVMPFNGMQPGDAWLWSRYREDEILMKRFADFTEHEFTSALGYYGEIGDRTVIKNSSIIKDARIGEDAYIKGANKLKNLTINSGEEGKTQIGEGCEIVNGIIGYGCRIFYGVKAVRFVMASHSQLKYGARLINSYLGYNATISCCEVLNSLIFPAHEQHHNNSFLCAAVVMGQSNIPAGATIGSNHNSRSADGEFIAGRGFWPGLCVSIKHNTKLASFTILAKGDYAYEMNIPIPFSLVSVDATKDRLIVMPAYWFLYNMYALARNSWKYADRDKRDEKIQLLENDYLAPDSVNEMFEALQLIETAVGKAFYKNINEDSVSEQQHQQKGKELLIQKHAVINELDIVVNGFENAKRKAVLIKVQLAYDAFCSMISYYGISQFMFGCENGIDWKKSLKDNYRKRWLNVGGQLIPEEETASLKAEIKNSKINTWQDVHRWYSLQGENYPAQKREHAIASLLQMKGLKAEEVSFEEVLSWFDEAVIIREKMVEAVHASRAKDYTNPFRKMMYDSGTEMNIVIGKPEENSFLKQQKEELSQFRQRVEKIKKQLSAAI